jgi:hypothetical protein
MKIDLTVRVQLLGDHTCSALGITVSSGTPVLALCRKLVAAGHDPSLPLEAWRGDKLCLRIRSIGEGAQLEVMGNGVGFSGPSGMGTALPRRSNPGPLPL